MALKLFCREKHSRKGIKILEIYMPEEVAAHPISVEVHWVEDGTHFFTDAGLTKWR